MIMLTNIHKDTLYFVLLSGNEIKCVDFLKVKEINKIGYNEVAINIANRKNTGPSFLSESPFILPMLVGAVVDTIKSQKKETPNDNISNKLVRSCNYELHTIKGRILSFGNINFGDDRFFSLFNKNLVKLTMPKDGKSCYIATVCYGDINAKEIIAFRRYRDLCLTEHLMGRISIQVYYFFSPYIAARMKSHNKLNNYIKEHFFKRFYNYVNKKIKQKEIGV